MRNGKYKDRKGKEGNKNIMGKGRYKDKLGKGDIKIYWERGIQRYKGKGGI